MVQFCRNKFSKGYSLTGGESAGVNTYMSEFGEEAGVQAVQVAQVALGPAVAHSFP